MPEAGQRVPALPHTYRVFDPCYQLKFFQARFPMRVYKRLKLVSFCKMALSNSISSSWTTAALLILVAGADLDAKLDELLLQGL